MRGAPPKMARRLCIVLALILIAAIVNAAAASAGTPTFNGTVAATNGTQQQTFSFSVSSPGQITGQLSWTTRSAVLTAAIVDPSGKQVALNSTTANPKSVTYNATATGTYKVRIKARTGSSDFSVSVSYPGVSVPSFAGVIGGGEAGHPSMYPSGLTVGPDGSVYVADTGNDQVKAYRPDGTLSWSMGVRGQKAAGNFSNPRDIAYLNGKLYVDDTGNNRVQVIDIATGTATAWPVKLPSSLGISVGKDANGQNIVLVAEDTADAIAVFSTDGTPRCTISIPPVVINNKPQHSAPRDAATNAAGTIYVAVYQQDRINEYPPVNGTTCPTSAQMIRTWGTHGNGTTQFLRPYGVDLDPAGNVYVADSDNERVQEFTGTGTYKATFGADTGHGGDLTQLRRVAVMNGQVYAADLWGYHIDRFSSPTAAAAQMFGGVGPTDGHFDEPSGITFNSAGDLYVADSVNQRIQRFTQGANGAAYSWARSWGTRGWGASDLDGFNWPRDLTYVPGSASLWVADTKNNRLLEFTPSGDPSGRNSIGTATTMHWPWAVDSYQGSLIIADTFSNRIASWHDDALAPTWTQTTVDGIAIKNPYDVAVANGTVYVADQANHRIVELDAATGAPEGSFGLGAIHAPQGVAVDPVSGSIWVADTSYNRLTEFTSTGQFVQNVGKLGSGNLQFAHPTHLDVHIDTTGHAYLYVVDTWNDRIQILDLNEN